MMTWPCLQALRTLRKHMPARSCKQWLRLHNSALQHSAMPLSLLQHSAQQTLCASSMIRWTVGEASTLSRWCNILSGDVFMVVNADLVTSTLLCCSTTGTSPLCQKDLQWMAASMTKVGSSLQDCGHPTAAANAESVACNAAIAALACKTSSLSVTVSCNMVTRCSCGRAVDLQAEDMPTFSH